MRPGLVLLVWAAAALAAGAAPAGAARAQALPAPVRHAERVRTCDILDYRLTLDVDPERKTCAGTAAVTFVPLRPGFKRLELDAAELRIGRVTLGTKRLAFDTSGETLAIRLDSSYDAADTLTVEIAYAAVAPSKGLYYITPDSGYPGRTFQIWTQGEPDDNHHWFPCYDYPNDKAASELIVTVPAQYTAISNGRLAGVTRDRRKGTATYSWAAEKPHVVYNISLVVGEFAEIKDAWTTVPLSYYVPPSRKADALRSFGKTPKMMDFYSRKTGMPYPWEKYAQTVVEEFIWGGEENVSATTLTDATLHDARAHLDYSSDGLVAHELAHMWFGDLLTCRDWADAWLNEGFATFMENRFTDADLGHDDAAKETMDAQTTLRNADVGDTRRPTVTDVYVAPNDLFDSRIYGKGSVVLNMLRDLLGEETFWHAIRSYVRKFAYGNVVTADFRNAVEEAAGSRLGWFFDEWVTGAGYPDLLLTRKWDRDSRTFRLTVRQQQKTDSLTGLFRFPVDVELWVHGEPYDERIWVSKEEETYAFPAYQEPQCVIFDPGSRVLKKVTFEKPMAEWLFQLQHAEEGVDRTQALDELALWADSAAVIAALKKCSLDDPFWDVRRSAAFALGDVRRTDVAKDLVAIYGDRDARVRAAAATSLGRYHDPLALATLRHAFEGDSSYGVAVAALRALVAADSAGRRSYCEAALARSSRNEMLRSAALRVLADAGTDEALGTVIRYTRYGVDRNIRIESIMLLASKWKGRDEAVGRLIELLGDPNFHVRRAVIAALASTGDRRAIGPLTERMERESDTRVAKDARDAVEKLSKAQQ